MLVHPHCGGSATRKPRLDRRTKLLVFTLMLYFLYTWGGGFIFHKLESSNNTDQRSISLNKSLNWLDQHKCVTREEMVALLQRVAQELQHGELSFLNRSTAANWNLVSAVFFATTVVTTIGYGHIAPVTNVGQIFCIFYALFGIPLTGIMLAAIGDRFNCCIRRFKTYALCTKRPRLASWVQSLIMFGGGVVLFLTLPAVLFWKVEGWSYWESWYYSFITLSTIGFGDFVIGTNTEKGGGPHWYRLLTSVWILLGLAWLACVISSLTEALRSRIEHQFSPEQIDCSNVCEVTGTGEQSTGCRQCKCSQEKLKEKTCTEVSLTGAKTGGDVAWSNQDQRSFSINTT